MSIAEAMLDEKVQAITELGSTRSTDEREEYKQVSSGFQDEFPPVSTLVIENVFAASDRIVAALDTKREEKMSKKRIFLPIILGTILTLSLITGSMATVQAEVSTVNSQALEQEIHDFSTQWNHMSETKNLEGMVALYAVDTLWLPPNAVLSIGTTEVRHTYARLFQAPNVRLVHTTEKISVPRSGDFATEIGRYNIQLDTPQGPFKDEGKYMFLLSRVEGEWKIAADMFNSSIPSAQTN